MNVADSSPASWPSVASSTSTSKPRRSAQREYMRSSISAQSWASVPPAPAWSSHDRVALVVCPLKQAAQSRARRAGRASLGDAAVELVDERRVAGSPASALARELARAPRRRRGAGAARRSRRGPSRARPSSVVTARAWSWSSHRFGSRGRAPRARRGGARRLVDLQVVARPRPARPRGRRGRPRREATFSALRVGHGTA